MSTTTKLVAAVMLLFALIVGAAYYVWHRGKQYSESGAAGQRTKDAQVVVDKQRDTVKNDTAALARADSALTRVIDHWHTDTVRLPPVPTRQDYDAGRTTLDSVFRALSSTQLRAARAEAKRDSVVSACSLYRDTCRKTTADLLELQRVYKGLSDALNNQVDHPPPRRRWGLGCAGGYGGVASGGRGYTGPGGVCGLTFSL